MTPKNRDGFVMSEGAGALVLESYEQIHDWPHHLSRRRGRGGVLAAHPLLRCLQGLHLFRGYTDGNRHDLEVAIRSAITWCNRVSRGGPVEFKWSQRFDLGRATGKLDPNYDDLLRISGGGKFAPYHRRFTFGSVAAHLAETFGTKGSPISLSTAVRGPDQMRSLCKQSKQPTPLKLDAVAAPNIADGQ